MQEPEDYNSVPASLLTKQHTLRGMAGVFVVLALLLVGAVAFVRYLL
jgi:hypothetical protein